MPSPGPDPGGGRDSPQTAHNRVHIRTLCKLSGKTGVEMEALTAASVAALTIYDMCKAVQKDMVIEQVRLVEKRAASPVISSWVRPKESRHDQGSVFAQVRELVGCDELSLPCDYASADVLRAALSERGDKWARWRSNPASSWWRSTRPWCRWIPPP